MDIISQKYIYLDQTLLFSLAQKYHIPVLVTYSQKTLALTIIPEALLNEKFLKEFYKRLNIKEQRILKYIVHYNGKDFQHDIKEKFKFNIEVMRRNKQIVYVWWLELLVYKNNMEPSIKECFLKFLQPIDNSQTNEKIRTQNLSHKISVEDITEVTIDKFLSNGKELSQKLSQSQPFESTVIFKIIYIFCKNEKIHVTQKGILTVKSLKLLEENLSLESDSILWFFNFLIKFNYIYQEKIMLPSKTFDRVMQKNDAEAMKDIFTAYMNFSEQYEFAFLPFVTFRSNGRLIQNLREEIIYIIKQKNINKWMSIDSIVDLIPINSNTLSQIMNEGRYGYYFSNEKGYDTRYDKLEDLRLVLRYFIKVFIGILSYLGVFNLAKTPFFVYAKEEFSYNIQRHPKEFNNIEYFKISDLGKYIIGLSDTFVTTNDFTLSLNSYSLEIKVNNPNNFSEMFLANIALKITDTKYKVDIKTFMQNINTVAEYKNMKESFIKKCDQLLENWEHFFESLQERMEGTKVVNQNSVLIKLQNNKELLRLITTHEKLKTKVLKADNLHIVVLKDDLPSVKKTLKEHGILI